MQFTLMEDPDEIFSPVDAAWIFTDQISTLSPQLYPRDEMTMNNTINTTAPSSTIPPPSPSPDSTSAIQATLNSSTIVIVFVCVACFQYLFLKWKGCV